MSAPAEPHAFSAADQQAVYRAIYDRRDMRHFSGGTVADGVLQRLLFVVIAAACVLGLLWRSHAGRLSAATLVLLTSAAGVAAALWQYFVAAQTLTCVFTLADRVMAASRLDGWMPEVFQARASCMDAAVRLFGVPYEFYSLALYLLLGGGALYLMLGRAPLLPTRWRQARA